MENSIYTQEELDILKLTKEKRLVMVEDMTKDGTPSYKEVEVINQMLTSLEKSVHDTVSNRLKHQDNNNKEAILASVAETIKALKSKQQGIREEDVELADIYRPLDILPGELDMDTKQYTLDEIQNTKEEE